MRSVAIVTDSASDIRLEIALRLGISVIPMRINMGGGDFRDGVDICIGQYLDVMRSMRTSPKTSMPSPTDFLQVYQALAERGYTEILSIHVSGVLSSTVDFARHLATSVFEDLHIDVVDSRAATVAEGAVVLEAAAVAAAGGSLDETLARALAIRDSVRIQFVPANLDNPVKGGRASTLHAAGASLLKMRPVLQFNDGGRLEVAHRVHGRHRAVRFLAEELAERGREQGELVYFALHTRAEQRLALLEEEIRLRGVRGMFGGRATVGPCVATHVGEGAIGVMSYPASFHCSELRGSEMFLALA